MCKYICNANISSQIIVKCVWGQCKNTWPSSLSSMKAPTLLPVSDANTNDSRGKMANVHPGHVFKNAPCPQLSYGRSLSRSFKYLFFSLSQNAQSFSMNCKVIGQCCSFLSVGHSRKGHHPPQARQMKQASRVICAHTMHLANTPNPTLQSCFMVFNLKIADSLSKKEHLELCWWQSTSMTSENIS